MGKINDEFIGKNGIEEDLAFEHDTHDTFLKNCSECFKQYNENACEHICSGNCRREGCNCECGEFHQDELE